MPKLLTEAELEAELAILQAEAIGWLRLDEGAYVHMGAPAGEANIVEVVGIPEPHMLGMNVLLLQ